MNLQKIAVQSATWLAVDTDAVLALVATARAERIAQQALTLEQVQARFDSFFAENPVTLFLARDQGQLLGLWVLYPHDGIAEANPGQTLNGHPLLSPDHAAAPIVNALLVAAKAWVEEQSLAGITFVTPFGEDLSICEPLYYAQGFERQGDYVEMVYHIPSETSVPSVPALGLAFQPLSAVTDEVLYECYRRAFRSGDAAFFFAQSELQRREYFFGELGLSVARQDPASLLLFKDGQLVGFAMLLPYGEANRHISCMCVLPEFRRQGLARDMLDEICRRVATQGDQSISLGTDSAMGAFKLYQHYGFEVLKGFTTWRWLTFKL